MSSKKRKAWKNKQRAERLMALRAALSMEYDGRPPAGLMKLNATQTACEIDVKQRRNAWATENGTTTGRMSSGRVYRHQNLPYPDALT